MRYARCTTMALASVAGCRLQVTAAACRQHFNYRRSSLQLDSIKASSARSCVSFEAHEKLSVSALKAEPSTDCSAAYSSSSSEQGEGGTERKACVVGCTVAPCQPGTGNQNHSQLPYGSPPPPFLPPPGQLRVNVKVRK